MTTDLPNLPKKEHAWAGTLADTKLYDSALEAYAAEAGSWLENCLFDLRNEAIEFNLNHHDAGRVLSFLLLNIPDQLQKIAQTAVGLRDAS